MCLFTRFIKFSDGFLDRLDAELVAKLHHQVIAPDWESFSPVKKEELELNIDKTINKLEAAIRLSMAGYASHHMHEWKMNDTPIIQGQFQIEQQDHDRFERN